MKERPILFNAEMVRAILDGRKTQTRRIVRFASKPNNNTDGFMLCIPHQGAPRHWQNKFGLMYESVHAMSADKPLYDFTACPYGDIGDRLWVRETHCWADELHVGYTREPAITIGYKADLSAKEMGVSLDTAYWNWDMVKWRPSIHMPRWVSRINLEVMDVRVERVQEISEEDAIAEGVSKLFDEWVIGMTKPLDEYGYRNYLWHGQGDITSKQIDSWEHQYSGYDTAAGSFSSLWEKINARRGYGWDSNPFVWVVDFNVI